MSPTSESKNLGPPWLIVGCGYTGARLARRLVARGERVVVARRHLDDARAIAGPLGDAARPIALDLGESAEVLAAAIDPGAIAVDSVPPRDDGGAGERRLIRACRVAGARRLVYLSSTGVYPPGGGAWVDEESPVGPASARGRRRLEAETALLDEASALGVSAVSLRIAAIYGPGRGVHERLRAGSYRVIGDGGAQVSRVHVDDLVSAIIAAGDAARLVRTVYTVADEAPMPSRQFADAVAEILDVPPPPSVPPEEVDPSVRAMLASDRKVSSKRLREELGVVLRYPSGLDGVRASLG